MTKEVAPSLTINRVFDAPVKALYEAWTDPAQMVQWMGPGEVKCMDVQIDLNVGGQYRIQMQSDEGAHVAIGEYLEITPNEHLKFTWAWEDGEVKDTLVTIDFRAEGKGSALTLMHENFPAEETAEKHTMGWNGCLEHLNGYLNKNQEG